MVAIINSVVGGGAVAIALNAITGASLGVAAAGGGVVAVLSLIVLLRLADRLLEERTGEIEALYPSPEGSS